MNRGARKKGKNKNRNSSVRNRGANTSRNTSVNSSGTTEYHGPILIRGVRSDTKVYAQNLVFDGAVLSTGAGLIQYQYSSDPTALSVLNPAIQWTIRSQVFREFRVLGFRFEYTPGLDGGTPSGTYPGPVYCVVEHGIAAAITTYAAGAQYSSIESFSLNARYVREVRMVQTDESDFQPVGSGPLPDSTLYFLKIFANGANSTTYGRVRLIFLVQFMTQV